jgi:hypothetical protein
MKLSLAMSFFGLLAPALFAAQINISINESAGIITINGTAATNTATCSRQPTAGLAANVITCNIPLAAGDTLATQDVLFDEPAASGGGVSDLLRIRNTFFQFTSDAESGDNAGEGGPFDNGIPTGSVNAVHKDEPANELITFDATTDLGNTVHFTIMEPEPATWTLLLAGGLALAARRKFRS